ncbi:MAG: polymer-forming cytoskeletal protein [Chloroflexota bacterium]
MKNLSKIIAVLTMMAFLFLPTQSVQAQDSSEPGKVVFGDSYTLESGQTLEGDLVVFGGNVTIEEDAVVTGSVVVFGGTIELEEGATIQQDTAMIGGTMDVNGEVDGDLFVMGGRITLNETAVIHGDISTMGGEIERDENAQVDGDILENVPAPAVQVPTVPVIPSVPNPPSINVNYNPFQEAFGVLMRALGVAGLAMLLALFLQPQLEHVSDAIIKQPVMAGSFGLLAVVAIVVMAITIILIPVAALAAFIVLPLAWLFGIIALGQEVGERLMRATNQTWAPVLATGAGTFVLMLLGGYIGMIPCAGWILPVLLGLVGIGGVVMTLFGTRLAPGVQSVAQPPVEVPPAS